MLLPNHNARHSKTSAKFVFLVITLIFFLSPSVNAFSFNTVENDRINIFSDLTVENRVGGNVVCFFGDVIILEGVRGDVICFAGNVTVKGWVAGDITVVGGNVKITSTGVVSGRVVSTGRALLEEGAEIESGGEALIAKGRYLPDISFLIIALIIGLAIHSFLSLVLGYILVAINPRRFMNSIVNVEKKAVRRILIGLAIFPISLLLAVLLSFTIIIPLLYIAFVTFSSIFSAVYFGRIILRAFKAGQLMNTNGKDQPIRFIELTTGVVTLTLIKILLLYLAMTGSTILNLSFYALFELIVNSLGTGIFVDNSD